MVKIIPVHLTISEGSGGHRVERTRKKFTVIIVNHIVELVAITKLLGDDAVESVHPEATPPSIILGGIITDEQIELVRIYEELAPKNINPAD